MKTTPHEKRDGSAGPASNGLLLIATNLLDLPAWIIAMIYRYRWTIEVFFRFFKHVRGCRHLLSRDPANVKIQTYCAIIKAIHKRTTPQASNRSWASRGLIHSSCEHTQCYVPSSRYMVSLLRKRRSRRTRSVQSMHSHAVLCWGLLAVAVGLCMNALALRERGYTSPPSFHESLDRMYLAGKGEQLRKVYPPDRVLAPAPLDEILPQSGNAYWERKIIQPLWHTPLTRLYKVEIKPGLVWYPGGPVSEGSEHLQWKPKSRADDVVKPSDSSHL